MIISHGRVKVKSIYLLKPSRQKKERKQKNQQNHTQKKTHPVAIQPHTGEEWETMKSMLYSIRQDPDFFILSASFETEVKVLVLPFAQPAQATRPDSNFTRTAITVKRFNFFLAEEKHLGMQQLLSP